MKGSQNWTDAQWQAYWDAQTLANAEIIKGDDKRLEAAKEAAKKAVKEEKAEADAMQKVADS